jgi:hypothetical protein
LVAPDDGGPPQQYDELHADQRQQPDLRHDHGHVVRHVASGEPLRAPHDLAAQGADAVGVVGELGSASFEAGQAWAGEATLDLFDSPTEELARLEVDEIIGGYYRQVGVVWDGGKTLATL